MRLPDHQPARAVRVVAYYLAAVAIGAGALQLRWPGNVSTLLSVLWAMGLLVPLAVLAPRRAPDNAIADTRPVLARGTRPVGPIQSRGTPPPKDV